MKSEKWLNAHDENVHTTYICRHCGAVYDKMPWSKGKQCRYCGSRDVVKAPRFY